MYELNLKAALSLTVVGAVIGFIWFASSFDVFHPMAILVIATVSLLIFFAYLSGRVGRPALWASGITPFEGALSLSFNFIGNLATPMLIGAFIIAVHERSSRMFLGTTIQSIGALFVLSMVPSFIPALLTFDTGSFIALGQRVALILFVGVFAHGFAFGGRSMLIAKTLVISTAILVGLSMLEFYKGMTVVDPLIQAVGGAEIGLSDLTLLGPGQFSDDLRLRGFGVSENRLAAWILLPVFLAMAWAITTKSIVSKMVALIALSMLIGGLIGAVSRSGFLGLVVGLLIIAISAYGTGRYKFVLMFLIGAVVTILLLRTTLGDIAILRFEGGGLVSDLRTGLWKASIHEFLRSPIIVGVGYGNFDATNYSGYYGAQSHSHNAALQLLVESGIVAALLFVALMARSIWVLARSSINETGEETIWRIAFMAGLVAVLVTDMFHVFTFDRFLWIALGFAAARELRLRADNDVRRVKSTAEAR